MSKRVESFVHAQIRKTIEKYFRYGKFHVFTSEASLKFKELMMRDCQIQMRITTKSETKSFRGDEVGNVTNMEKVPKKFPMLIISRVHDAMPAASIGSS